MENETPTKPSPTERVKSFWQKHKTKILVSGLVVTTASAAVLKGGLKQHDDFLKEKDLYDEFYHPEEPDAE